MNKQPIRVLIGIGLAAAMLSLSPIAAAAAPTEETVSFVEYKSEKAGFTSAYLLEGKVKTTVKTSATKAGKKAGTTSTSKRQVKGKKTTITDVVTVVRGKNTTVTTKVSNLTSKKLDESANNKPQQGVTKTSIKVGTTQPITGVAAIAGQGLIAGVTLAINEINAKGGINGRKIELVPLDDGFDVPRSVANMRRLVEQEKVYAILSPAGSQALPASWSLIKEKRVPVWGPVSPADAKIEPLFVLGPSRTEQLRKGIDWHVKNGCTKIALIGQPNELGAEGKAAVELQLKVHKKLKLVASEEVAVRSQEVVNAVLKVRDSGAECLVMATDNVQVALVLKKIKELGLNIKVNSDNGAGGTGGTNMVGLAGDAADGFIGALQVSLPTDLSQFGVKAWRTVADKSSMPQATNNYSLQTYTYTKAFFKAVQRLGDDLNWNRLFQLLETSKVKNQGAAPDITCGPLPTGHSCAKGAALAQYSTATKAWKIVSPFGPPQGG
jgi:branched-chain amino acid transport system substrate-binding protein